MKDTEFQSHKESLIAEKQGYPSTLIDESNDFWEQIWTHRHLFDTNKHVVRELIEVSKNEMINWCRRLLGARSRLRRHLCIYVVGVNAQEGDVDDPVCKTSSGDQNEPRRTVLIDNLDEFQRNLEIYPVRF